VQELRATRCNFGEKCNNICKNSEEYTNKGEKICVFLHPEETLENFYNRALKKNDKKLEKIEIIVESDEEVDTAEVVVESEKTESLENEDVIEDNEDTSDESVNETLEIFESESEVSYEEENYEIENEKIEACEEACIIISLPRNEIGKLCELILSSDIKARITKQ
jgi:hypothetical protein